MTRVVNRAAWSLLMLATLNGCSGHRTCASDSFGARMPQAPSYVGLSQSAAIAKAEAAGTTVRVMCRNGAVLGGTADLRPDRVNLDVDQGEVTVAYYG
jgi:hypothetical protein